MNALTNGVGLRKFPAWAPMHPVSGHGCLLTMCLLMSISITSSGQTQQSYYPLMPKYQVLGVIYAPPGATSSVTYDKSTSVGSSHSIGSTSSNMSTQTTSSTSGFTLFGFGSSTTTSDTWTSTITQQNTHSLEVSAKQSNGIKVQGPISSALGLDHDNDLIVVWLNPVMDTTLTYNPSGSPIFSFSWAGLRYNSCDLTDPNDPVKFFQLSEGCDPLQYAQPDILYVPVYCLKNPYSTIQACSQYWQNANQQLYFTRFWDRVSWGADPKTGVSLGPALTVQDMADILRSDPFVTQTLVADNYQIDPTTHQAENPYTNPCHPSYGISFDPNTVEIIPDSSTFSAPFSGSSWPTNYCGKNPSKPQMQRFDDDKRSVEFQVPCPTCQPITTTGAMLRQSFSTYSQTASDSHTHSVNVNTVTSLGFTADLSFSLGGGVGIGSSLFGAGFNYSTSSGTGNSWTDTQTWSDTQQIGLGSEADYSVTGPSVSDNYQGPTTFNVYSDNVYGTYALWTSLENLNPPTLPTSSPIGVSMTPAGAVTCSTPTTCDFGKITVGKSSGAITVKLTNASPYQMTMASPTLSFSDLAPDPKSNYVQVSSFVVVAGSDLCSGKLLLTGQSCTVRIKFSPRVAAAPNASQAFYPVAAYLVAAGTEGIPFFAGANCSNGYCSSVLVTNTVISVTSPGQETFTAVSGKAVPVPVDCDLNISGDPDLRPYWAEGALLPFTLMPPSTAFSPEQGQSPSQLLTFTNYCSQPVTINSGAGAGVVLRGVTATDKASYSVPSSTDHCTAATIQPLGTCTVNILYSQGSNPAGSIANTEVSLAGAVSGSGDTPVALIPAAISTTLTGLVFSGGPFHAEVCEGPLCGYDNPATVTVSNDSTTTTINNIQASVSGAFSSSSGCTSLAPGSSCTVTVDYGNTCTPPQGLYSCSVSGSGTLVVTGKFADTSLPASSSVGVSGTYRYRGCRPNFCP